MIEKKLVKKEVSVQVKEWREVPMYEYQNHSYTKESLKPHLKYRIKDAGHQVLDDFGRTNGFVMKVRKISQEMDANTYIEIFKAIKTSAEALEHLKKMD